MDATEDRAETLPKAEPARATAAEPSVKPKTASPIEKIEIKARTGFRKVRGKPTEVQLPVLDVHLGGQMVALTGDTPGKPVMAIREILTDEIAPILAAVVAHRGDSATPVFVPRPKAK